MKKVLTIIVAVVLTLLVGVSVFELILIGGLKKEKDQFNKFFKENYGMEFKDWDGEKVVYTEAQLVDDISDALDEAIGVFINGKTVEEFVGNLVDELKGEFGGYEDIHEIYDDTAVINAYKTGNAEGLSEEDLYTLNFASQVIDEIITDDMSEYEKELAVYNWLFNYVQYDESEFSPMDDDEYDYNYYPYGVFKYHSAICVGNATTFKLFMGMLDIDCKIIHSTADGEHAWNMVCIEEEWYHVDLTFDSGIKGKPMYNYFNVPTAFKIDDGYEWDVEEYPEANSIKHTYIFRNHKTISSIEELPKLVKDTLDGKDSTLVVKSKEYYPAMEDLLDKINNRLSDTQEVYLLIDMESVEDDGTSSYYYVIEIYDEEDWEDFEEDDTDDEDDTEDEGESELPDNIGDILDGIF